MRRINVAHLVGVCSLLASSSLYAWQDVSSDEAYLCATDDSDCYILDVRTDEEWRWVGHPGVNKAGYGAELEGKVVNISWLIMWRDELVENWRFLRDVKRTFGWRDRDVKLITMCRSGSRSKAAADALEAAGYRNVFNMTHGFEGDRDPSGYRIRNGWKMDGFPYNDSGEGAY
jgi:rhodanese-related sulfurtransferase